MSTTDSPEEGTGEKRVENVEGILPEIELSPPPTTSPPAEEDDKKATGTAAAAAAAKSGPSSTWRQRLTERIGNSTAVQLIKKTTDTSRRLVADAASASWKWTKGLFVTEETEYACKQIWKILMKYVSDISSVDLATGLLLISQHYQRFPHRSPTVSRRLAPDSADDRAFAELSVQVMRHASASYGWKMLCGFMTYALEGKRIPVSTLAPALSLDDEASSLESLKKHTGIAEEDVLETKWTSEPFSPGHYVAFDRELKSIVVSIRGTWGVRDSVTDLVANGAPFSFGDVDGFVHEGVFRCASKKAEALEKLLSSAVQGDRVIVTGHSLGGGVATLLALLLAKKHPEWDVACFAFAPAASLTRPLAESPAVRAIVRSYVFRDDVVPRLSYGSLELLKRTIQKLLTQSTTASQRIFQMVASGNVLGDSLTQKMERKLGVRAEIDIETAVTAARIQRGLEQTFMFPAGRVFYLAPVSVPSDSSSSSPPNSTSPPASSSVSPPLPITTVVVDTKPQDAAPAATVPSTTPTAAIPRKASMSKFAAAKLSYTMEEVATSEIDYWSEVVVSGNMFIDHLPHKYEFAINRAADDITGTDHNIDIIQLTPPLLSIVRRNSSKEIELAPVQKEKKSGTDGGEELPPEAPSATAAPPTAPAPQHPTVNELLQ